jgi:CRP/FNR family transcriptional regulator, cyclic AMP receptor protein
VAGIDIGVLRQIPLFQDVSDTDLKFLAALARLRTCKPRDIIVAQGEPAGALYVLSRGQVSVSASTDGRTVTIGELGPTEIIGEISLLDGGSPSATITAMTKVELVELDRRSFADLLDRRPRIAVALLPILAARLRRLTKWANEIAVLSVPERLAKWLVGMIAEQGQQVGPRRFRIVAKVSQTELAKRVGVTRESVNKHLRRLERAEIVVREAGHLVVTDLETLRTVARLG